MNMVGGKERVRGWDDEGQEERDEVNSQREGDGGEKEEEKKQKNSQ